MPPCRRFSRNLPPPSPRPRASGRCLSLSSTRLMSEELVLWHDFNVSLVTASAGLLGLLFVALSIHVRVLSTRQNAELRAVARTIFLGYVLALAIGFLALMPQTLSAFGLEVLVVVLGATLPFAAAARSGLRATGVGYDRRVTVIQFVAGFVLFAISIAASIGSSRLSVMRSRTSRVTPSPIRRAQRRPSQPACRRSACASKKPMSSVTLSSTTGVGTRPR